MSEIFLGSSHRGLFEALPGKAEGQVPQMPKKYRTNGSRGRISFGSFSLCAQRK